MNTAETSRRTFLKTAAALLGGIAVGVRQALGSTNTEAAWRARFAALPIEPIKLTNLITLFTGPGGNVVVRNGEEGKVVVDTFVQGAFPGLKQRLDAMGKTPILYVINTHWHFDHTDNNETFRQTGAEICAQENTKKRLGEPHELLGMHIPPSPAGAMPTRTFRQFDKIEFNLPGTEEFIDMEHVPRAHTDGDLFVRFVMGDVLHMGDSFSNGTYPYIDVGTGGSIDGMIAAVERALKVTNPGTKIVPGHGPLGDRMALARYRDMLATVRERVQKLKKSGRTEQEVVASKPTADLDPMWSNGLISADEFVPTVYKTL